MLPSILPTSNDGNDSNEIPIFQEVVFILLNLIDQHQCYQLRRDAKLCQGLADRASGLGNNLGVIIGIRFQQAYRSYDDCHTIIDHAF